MAFKAEDGIVVIIRIEHHFCVVRIGHAEAIGFITRFILEVVTIKVKTRRNNRPTH